MEKNELGDVERHIALYAKGHYIKGNLILDLRKIISEFIGPDFEHIGLDSVYHFVVKTYNLMVPENQKGNILFDLFRRVSIFSIMNENISITVKDIISNLLGLISITKVRGEGDDVLFDLGEPSASVLPLPISSEKNKHITINNGG